MWSGGRWRGGDSEGVDGLRDERAEAAHGRPTVRRGVHVTAYVDDPRRTRRRELARVMAVGAFPVLRSRSGSRGGADRRSGTEGRRRSGGAHGGSGDAAKGGDVPAAGHGVRRVGAQWTAASGRRQANGSHRHRGGGAPLATKIPSRTGSGSSAASVACCCPNAGTSGQACLVRRHGAWPSSSAAARGPMRVPVGVCIAFNRDGDGARIRLPHPHPRPHPRPPRAAAPPRAPSPIAAAGASLSRATVAPPAPSRGACRGIPLRLCLRCRSPCRGRRSCGRPGGPPSR